MLMGLGFYTFSQNPIDSTASLSEEKTNIQMQGKIQDQVLHEFDENKWKKLAKDFDYGKADIKTKKTLDLPTVNKLWMKVLFYGLVLAALVFILIKLFNAKFANRNFSKKARFEISSYDNNDIGISNNLETLLDAALINGDLKSCVRLHYLIVLRELDLKSWIKWQKEKTNRHYLFEMKGKTEDYSMFQKITMMYEKTWYGKENIPETNFINFQDDIKGFVNNIRTK